jgi:FMN phosphatase YigB (HAD superfamily)
MAIRAVSCDFHGTLAVVHPSPGAIYARVAAAHGVTVAAETLDARFGPAFAAVKSRWAVPFGDGEGDARAFWLSIIAETFPVAVPVPAALAIYEVFATPAAWRLLPGATAALALCTERGLPVAITSNFDLRLQRLVPALGLTGLAQILPSSLFGAPKPDPELLLTASCLLAVQPDELLHIGDSSSEDGGAARAAGCPWLPVGAEGVTPEMLSLALDGVLNGAELPA